MTFTKDVWYPDSRAWFEYHCFESNASQDADLWHHSHRAVTVVFHDDTDHDCMADALRTVATRADEGMPCIYTVRFDDGHEAQVFEDELLTSPDGYYRPDPTK